ncbi:MAG: hypothetical protein KDD01_18485 [Phaeodactylibacter sp.]|nr:hypothetical protein [Phaeodactylibacter sp.]
MTHPIKLFTPGLIFRIVLAVIAGEFLLVLLTTIVQETIFGGITYTHSPISHLLFGGAGTFLAAFIAGLAAYLLAGRKSVIPHIIISLLIIAESIWLIFYRESPDPLWFEATAAFSLLLGVWLGALIFKIDPEALSKLGNEV